MVKYLDLFCAFGLNYFRIFRYVDTVARRSLQMGINVTLSVRRLADVDSVCDPHFRRRRS